MRETNVDVWTIAAAHLLTVEGGFVDHPRDPGGATNRGVTLATYRALEGREKTVADLKALTREGALALYQQHYWRGPRIAALPAPLAIATFDAAVNHGPHRAVIFLQAALGVTQDGDCGPKTLAAAAAADADAVLIEMSARRMWFYGRLSTFRDFGLGWSRRLMGVMHLCLTFGTQLEEG